MQTLSVKEAARHRRCTLKYVYDLLAAGRLRGARKHGGQWRIPVDSLAATVTRSSRGAEDESVGDQKEMAGAPPELLGGDRKGADQN
jgi:excisionase family DNA binding protein